jgi:hypothetical protein
MIHFDIYDPCYRGMEGLMKMLGIEQEHDA